MSSALHPSLVSADFERVLAIARGHGVLGCKVNGAGGDGAWSPFSAMA